MRSFSVPEGKHGRLTLLILRFRLSIRAATTSNHPDPVAIFSLKFNTLKFKFPSLL